MFAPCDRTVIQVIEGFSCVLFPRVIMTKVGVSLIVLLCGIGCASSWCVSAVCGHGFFNPFSGFFFGCGQWSCFYSRLSAAAELVPVFLCSLWVCLFLLIVKGVFLAGVFEGVGGSAEGCDPCRCVQRCQWVCLFLLIAEGVFFAGVFEGFGGCQRMLAFWSCLNPHPR